MDVGYLILCASDGWNDVTDAQVYREEVELARMADDLGFSVIWAVEHHFDGYSFVPDNALMAAHLAATCKNADVGTAAFILPWHDPLRVAERITMLDHLTDGRLRIGFGRGAARMEFNGFREGSMDESRDRFNESIDIILRAQRRASSKATALSTNSHRLRFDRSLSARSRDGSIRSPTARTP